MKKKKFLSVLLTLVVAACALPLFACAADTRAPANGKIEQGHSVCYAFTASKEVMEITATTSVKDYMEALKAEGKLAFEGENGDYGYYVKTILGLGSLTVDSKYNDDGTGSYTGYDWMVYTTLTSIDGMVYSSDDATFVYNGITLYKAAYGVSGLPCIEGQTYAFVYERNSTSW